ncbi:MAG: DUF2851 family protein, partial [Capnocytophaga sp.]|nr:DUF2851 family protein [Capnocytophaga sp.]
RNRLSGPDFIDVRLQINDLKWAGSVEMHLKSSYWYAHRHEQDKAYANVILHVVWEHDVEVFDTNQQIIPTLELKNLIDIDVVQNYVRLLSSENKFISCEKYYSQSEKMVAYGWNKQLFAERLQYKSLLVENLLKQTHSDWEKVLFLMLLKNFGGTVNGEAFLEMGKTLDFSIIRKEKNVPLQLEALFLGQTGLLSVNYNEFYFQKLVSEYEFMQKKYNLKPSFAKIHFSKLRPQGFPTIRLSQLAQLYENIDGLFSKVIDIQYFNEFKKIFVVSTSEFWDTHYTFGKTSAKTKKKISTSLIELIWINTIIPIKYLYFKSLGKDVSDSLSLSLQKITAEQNTIITKFKELGANIESAFHTQILLQQYNNYCSVKRCLDCHIGIFLLKHKLLS